MASAQIIAKPGDDERHASQVRTEGLQRFQRRGPVARRVQHMPVFPVRRAQRRRRPDGLGRIAKFSGAGYQAHAPDQRTQPLDGPQHLERQLRNAIAIIRERHLLENNIREGAIGWGVRGAFLRDDQRIRRLRFIAAVNPHHDGRWIDLLPVGPYATHHRNGTLAESHREIRRIGVGGLRRAATALAASGLLVRGLDESRRPDQLAADADTPVNARHRGAFRRCQSGESCQMRTNRVFGPAAKQGLIDDRAKRRSDRATENGAKRTADKAADETAGRLQNKSRHEMNPFWRARSVGAGKGEGVGQPSSPPGRNGDLAHTRAVVRVHHRVRGRRDGQMLGGRVRAPAKQQDVAGLKTRDVNDPEMSRARVRESLLATGFGPVGRIGSGELGLWPDNLAPDAPHEAKTIASNAPHRGLMQIRRADPRPRARDDQRTRPRAHRNRLPPSIAGVLALA